MKPRIFPALAGGWFVFVSMVSAAEPTWQIIGDHPIEGQLREVYGPLALIVGKQTSSLVPIAQFDDGGIAQVADFLEARDKAASPAWSQSDSPVIKSLRGRLQRLDAGKLVAYEAGERAEPDLFLVYFSAHWCAPCRHFTPRLVDGYNRLQEKHPGRFELIFVSSDNSAGEQAKYAREAAMPWPMVKYSAASSVKPLTRWAGRGIPCLVLLSRDGDLIAHSYRGEDYVGPDFVWTQFEKIVALMEPGNPQTRRIMHPVAVRRHVAAANGASRQAMGYQIQFNSRNYQGLDRPALSVVAEIDASGAVLSAAADPELPVVVAHQLSRDAKTWLFLPQVEDGQATASSVRFELNL